MLIFAEKYRILRYRIFQLRVPLPRRPHGRLHHGDRSMRASKTPFLELAKVWLRPNKDRLLYPRCWIGLVPPFALGLLKTITPASGGRQYLTAPSPLMVARGSSASSFDVTAPRRTCLRHQVIWVTSRASLSKTLYPDERKYYSTQE